MKLILSTSNIMGAGSSIRRSPTTKSNTELVSSLRTNFAEHSGADQNGEVASVNGNSNGNGDTHTSSASQAHTVWTRRNGDTLEVPALDFSESALLEEREQYDITVKLFYLPGGTSSSRDVQTREALDLVMKQLHVQSIDLLIVSFPGIYFDEEEDCPDKISTRGPVEAEPEPLERQIGAWNTAEALYDEGVVARLGVAEFGKERLETFLDKVRLKPSVNQINLRDCCSVPKELMTLAKSQAVELLVHNDCSNILPRGTTRDLLGPGQQGAGVLSESVKTGHKRKSSHVEDQENGVTGGGLHGEVQPQWVVKYTAVVKNRGVVENKGYFAVAELT
ncbi:Putative NADP-dependent oxidoreductase domain, glutamate--cysteine ligase regulatory subunit [Septoria linicola]|uniref:GCS light chain n=1 Tax=Septoria linicola TaxID=215465 RepID=A0A9Q9AF28_9PEZI|nr:putative NADP-dependent oxidoreductase domain, glutamate--cysteine ligase regulatory subunit [Septoria linicola]USW47842.1 Putative NADP-dependent oxidoreductase domain, glutamate--cysteine ligase regulatory subunit [Septoria linicola]